MNNSGEKPLSGLKVIELSTFLAAPACTKLLVDWGAEVIKVESFKGDPFRTFGPNFNVTATEDENPLFDSLNGSKRSIVLDIKKPSGLKILYRLLDQADIFVTNNRDKALIKAGLDYETIKDRFPKLIYAHLTGFGDVGPKKDAPGFDTVAFWASSGFLADMPVNSGSNLPVNAPTGMGDVITSMMLCSALLGALYARERTGRGDRVTVSLYGTAIWAMSVMITAAQDKYNYKYPKERYELAPCSFMTKDGVWIQTTILEYDRYFPSLCKVLGVPEMAEDSRFKTLKESLKPENKRYQIELFEKIYATKTADEWITLIREADIVVDKLNHFKNIHYDKQALQNEFVSTHTLPNGDTCSISRPSARFDSMKVQPTTWGPKLGADTHDILNGIGLSAEEIRELEKEKIVLIK